MIRLCREDKNISSLNEKSLESDRLTIINQDAYKFLEENETKYDVIIVDLPDPNNEALNKLYSNVFYRLCGNALTEDGIINVQSTSPYYATEAFWCINKTLESEAFFVKPYHLQVPAFGVWGFNMASKKELDDDYSISVETKYLEEESVNAMFCFAKDEKTDNVEINRLSKPVLIQYYMEAVRNWE